MDKHAYLILAHTNPAQLKCLLSLLDDERNDIFIHIDKKAPFDYSAVEGCCTKSRVECINPRIRVTWGGVSIVRVEMTLLEAAIRTPHSYYHIISGLDLPIKSQDYIHDFFNRNAGKEFLDLWEMKSHTLNRVQYFTLFPEGNHFFLTYWLNQVLKALLRLLHIRANRGIEFRQGSQWMSITHDFASYIVKSAPWVDKVFSHSCICDEIFIPTVLQRSPFRNNLYLCEESRNHAITCGNMRLIDWSRGASIRHPWIFTEGDFDFLASSSALWARKFDERVDRAIIDRVASELAAGGILTSSI